MNAIQKGYAQWAAQYDSNVNPTRDLDASVTQCVLGQVPFNHVLELGCGTGKNTQWFCAHGDSVVGLDFSQAMLALATERVSSNAFHPVLADLNEMWPVDPETADLVSANLVLEHLECLGHVFHQAHRALRPGGHLFVSELHPDKQRAGSKPRFDTEQGTVVVPAFVHLEAEYREAALQAGFDMLNVQAWHDPEVQPDLETGAMPRLLTVLCVKPMRTWCSGATIQDI